MVEVLGVNCPNECHVVHDLRRVGQALGDPLARLAMAGELPARAKQLRGLPGERLHECEALALHQRRRKGLAIQLLEFALRLEELKLARGSGHEKVNDALGPRRVVGAGTLAGRRSIQGIPHEQGRQGQLADAHAAILEELAPGALG